MWLSISFLFLFLENTKRNMICVIQTRALMKSVVVVYPTVEKKKNMLYLNLIIGAKFSAFKTLFLQSNNNRPKKQTNENESFHNTYFLFIRPPFPLLTLGTSSSSWPSQNILALRVFT